MGDIREETRQTLRLSVLKTVEFQAVKRSFENYVEERTMVENSPETKGQRLRRDSQQIPEAPTGPHSWIHGGRPTDYRHGQNVR